MSNELYFETGKGTYLADAEEDYLGGGQTAGAYRVTLDSNVYALKLLTDSAYEQRFFQEVDWLIDFMTAPSTYDLEVNGKRLVPRVYDQQRQGEDRFFVMDLAPGNPLDQILRGQPGYLNEVDALTIAEQLCRVFHCLHQELRRSYLDFQPRNVFWDDKNRQIMVIDWNLLSEKGQADVAEDLLSLGRLLYRMLTGVDMPSRGLGEAERWNDVSLGAQLILQRALHRNPAYRFKTAEEMRQSILLLLQRWSIGADQLVMQAGKSNNAYTSSADEVKKQESLEEAAVLLDLASRSSKAMSSQIRDVVYPTVKEEVDAAYDRSKPLEEGKHKINLGKRLTSAIDYEKAVEQFRRAYEEAPDFNLRLESARWMLIAEAGAAGSESFSKHEETYLKALTLMQDQDYASVVELIDENVERAGGAGIIKLKREAQAWLAFEEAGQDSVRVRRENPIEPARWQAVSDLYGEVLTLTQDLEYQDLLLEEWGDIESRQIPFMHRAAALREGAKVLIDVQALLDSEPEQGIKEMDRLLGRKPGDVLLLDMILQTAEEWIGFGRNVVAAERARRLLDVALRWAGSVRRNALENAWARADAVVRADKALRQAQVAFDRIPRDLKSYQASLLSAITLRELVGDTADVEQVLRQDMDRAVVERDLAIAEIIALISVRLPGSNLDSDVERLRQNIEGDKEEYGGWLRRQVGQLADPDLAKWQMRLQEGDPLADMVSVYILEVQNERQRREEFHGLNVVWKSLHDRLDKSTDNLSQLRILQSEYTDLSDRVEKSGLDSKETADLVVDIRHEQLYLEERIPELEEQERARVEQQVKVEQAVEQEQRYMAPLVALWTAVETLDNRHEQKDTQVGLLRAVIRRTKQAPYPDYEAAQELGQIAEQKLEEMGEPVTPPEPEKKAREGVEFSPVPIVQAELDPGIEKRMRRNSWIAALVSTGAAVALLLLGGWWLSQSPQPSDEEIQGTATAQAGAIAAAVGEAFAEEKSLASVKETVVAAQATQGALATQTKAAAETTATVVAVETVTAAATATVAAQIKAATQTAVAGASATAEYEATVTTEAIITDFTNQVSLEWPENDAVMAVAPWTVLVAPPQDGWPAGNYALHLDGQPLVQFKQPKPNEPLIYTRSIESDFDGFPDLSEVVKNALSLDSNGQLPEGAHQLQVVFDVNADGQPDAKSLPVKLAISSESIITATVKDAADFGELRLEAPGVPGGTFTEQGILNDETLVILGRVEIRNDDGKKDTWYLWQADPDNRGNPERRGWTLARYFTLLDGRTTKDVPYLAPPLPAQ